MIASICRSIRIRHKSFQTHSHLRPGIHVRRNGRAFHVYTKYQKPQQSDWSSTQYLKFNNERTRPAADLLARIPLSSPKHIIDLGCGPGNSTTTLHQRYPNATIQGIDSSKDMLKTARKTLPNIEFIEADLTQNYQPAPSVDLLFSNAVFQWLPDDQRLPIMRNLLSSLRTDGVLAVQVPDNFDEPSHRAMREVAQEGPWRDTLEKLNPARAPFPDVRQIYNDLKPLSSTLDIWHTHYYHVLEDASAIVEWVKGTGLRPFVDPLSKDQRHAFMTKYLAKITKLYTPLEQDGKVMLKYPRLFVVAVRA